MSTVKVRTPAGIATARRPRVANVNSMPRPAANWVHAVLMIPVPPMNKTLIQPL